MLNEPHTAPLTDEERAYLVGQAAVDFAPWDNIGGLKAALDVKRIEVHGNALILASALMKFTKPELIEKFAKLEAEQTPDDEMSLDMQMIYALEAAKEFFDAASSVVDDALVRMTVVNAALTLRESGGGAS
jgi:hypothetical protein